MTVLVPLAADAHTRSESYSHWYVSNSSVTAQVTIPLREVMLLYQVADATLPPGDLFLRDVQASAGVAPKGTDCELTGSNALSAPSGFVRTELSFDCAGATPTALSLRAMYDVAPAHVNFARVHAGGRQFGETLLTDSADTWDITGLETAQRSPSFAAFLMLGAEHIAGGIDHIAFLLGLMLVAGSVGRTIVAVTGFTLGHSLSLAAAVLGYVHAEGRLVEAFIGFTVALVAVEYFIADRRHIGRYALLSLAAAAGTGAAAVMSGALELRALATYLGFGLFSACYLLAAGTMVRTDPKRIPLLLFVATLCFGLVHGFGFAGFLMDTGLLGGALFVPLLGFNLGVELGQLALVAVALLAARVLGDHVPRALPQLVAAGLASIGVYWFVGRTLG